MIMTNNGKVIPMKHKIKICVSFNTTDNIATKFCYKTNRTKKNTCDGRTDRTAQTGR